MENPKKTQRERIQESLEALKKRTRNKPAARQGALSHKLKAAMGEDFDVTSRTPELVANAKKVLAKHVGASANANTLPFKKTLTAVAEHLVGSSQKEVELKYDLANGYLNSALKRIFPNREAMEQVMEEILLANTVVCASVLNEKAPEMSGKDAAVATGIMAQRYLEVRKARQNNFQGDLPVQVILQLESTMKKVEEKHGPIIDI